MEALRLIDQGLDGRRPPAMLIGHLNLIRPLGLAQIPIVLVTAHADDIALRSRYLAGHLLIPGLEPEHQLLTLERLLAAGAELGRRLGVKIPLLYGSDEALELIHRFRSELAQHYLFLLNDDALARAMADKELFYLHCRECGVLVPRTTALGTLRSDELAALPAPAVLKPRAKAHWLELKRDVFRGRGKAQIFERPELLLEDVMVRRHSDHLVLSEYIPGDDRSLCSFHGFADESSRLLGWFAGRKLRTYPALTGESSFIELYHAPALVDEGRSVIRKLGVRGPFKIDFKRSAADGRYYVLEINARYNLWHYLGAVSGVNLPALGYYHLQGKQPPPGIGGGEYRTDHRWVNLYLDYATAREMRKRGEISYPRWLLSLVGRNVYSAFAWTDPMPFVGWMREFLHERALRTQKQA